MLRTFRGAMVGCFVQVDPLDVEAWDVLAVPVGVQPYVLPRLVQVPLAPANAHIAHRAHVWIRVQLGDLSDIVVSRQIGIAWAAVRVHYH